MSRIILALLIASYLGPYTRVEHGVGCLFVSSHLYRCYDRAGVALLGGAETDHAYRAGELLMVAPDGGVSRAVWQVRLGVVLH